MANRISKKGREIRDFALRNIRDNPQTIAAVLQERFGLSRQNASKYLRDLIAERLLTAQGNTRARTYGLAEIANDQFILDVDSSLQEDVVWRTRVRPLLAPFVEPNVLNICLHGFTEMLNNVIDHSGSEKVFLAVSRTAIGVELMVKDYGVGIFQKIQHDFNLNDPRHALLELSKGKLTSDNTKHSGEGIFFTSRMFDFFSIRSRRLFFTRTINSSGDWLLEVDERPDGENSAGTCVFMDILADSKRTSSEIFERFTSEFEADGFSRTHVPIKLSAYDDDQLVSRSAAKRVLARVSNFREVLLDFQGVTGIGQAFADEIFRVFPLEHPEVLLIAIHTTPQIDQMINRAKGTEVPSAQMALV
jgi:anti-sigma regulatory factor (Ser/Thr protein kinase)